MITKQAINEIYRKYKKRPKSADNLNLALLFEAAHPSHGIEIIGNMLRINSIPPSSPFFELTLSTIHAIIAFEQHIAIVMHSSIIFLNRYDNGVTAHIKPIKPSLLSRLTHIFTRHALL